MFGDIEYRHSHHMNKPYPSNTRLALLVLYIWLKEQNTDINWCDGNSHDLGFGWTLLAIGTKSLGCRRSYLPGDGKDGIVNTSSPHRAQHLSLRLMAQACIWICISLSFLKTIGQGWVSQVVTWNFTAFLPDVKCWKGSRKSSNSEARWQSNECYKFICHVSGL